MADVFRKSRADAPPGFFACEAAGLRWLTAPGGAPVVRVLGVDDDGIDLERLVPVGPTPATAEAFGRGLARTHAAGAVAFGVPPDGWDGDGFFGPLGRPYPLRAGHHDRWGEAYAALRLEPLAGLLPERRADLDRLAARLTAGAWTDDVAPARLHGDLWSGNVMWTAGGATLVDPAAHGGHPLTDLAMLDLFGLPHLGRVLDAYAEVAALPDGWRELLGLHQVYPVGMHVVLFGGAYADALDDLLHRYA